MNKKKYIDGNVAILNGTFYAADIIAGADESYKIGVDEIIPTKNGMLCINEDFGSIFDIYFIKGEFSTGKIDGSRITGFNDNTYNIFIDDLKSIYNLFENSFVPQISKDLFNQQIYISVFGALEYYLYCSFLNHVCRNYDIYTKVLHECSDTFERLADRQERIVLKGDDSLTKEKIFIEKSQIIVYHNIKKVNKLFKSAFGVDNCLSELEDEIEIRHDLVHRMGRNIEGNKIIINREQVYELIEKVKSIVDNIKKYSPIID